MLGYAVTRQKGSHIRMTTQQDGENHEVIPCRFLAKLGPFDQRRSQATATSICLGLAFSLFDTCTVSMPSLNSAFPFSASASSGSVNAA